MNDDLKKRLKTFIIIMTLSLIVLLILPKSFLSKKKQTTIALPIEIENIKVGQELYIEDIEYDIDSSKKIIVRIK